ncbi:hypothetical protein C2L64_51500 [Paraburkholderia hospita]|uniref:Uncharacterized protein n=1 Tax=Paraburkholderia hospita TaxID=169430 RepID=A0AAN1JMC4_9BURK|nr:hypothetical protein C2L64_51500 [Paraburkholderia hospita]
MEALRSLITGAYFTLVDWQTRVFRWTVKALVCNSLRDNSIEFAMGQLQNDRRSTACCRGGAATCGAGLKMTVVWL